jgi:hypothetical protein
VVPARNLAAATNSPAPPHAEVPSHDGAASGPIPRAPAEPYTARAIKGTALLEEMRALLRAWRPGETAREFQQRVRAEDLLDKATASRRDDLVQRVFVHRFLVDGEEPAASVRRLLDARGHGPWFAQLCLLLAARSDVVIREAVTVFLPAARTRGAGAVATPDFVRFLEEQEERGRMPRPWSHRVRESVAQHALHQLTDLGVLGAPRRGVRPILLYTPGSLAITWLACELHRRGVSDAAVVEHRDWHVWQMQEHDVREVLDRLSDLGLWVYQGAGSIIRIAWTWSDWNAVRTVLEGTSVD